MNLDVKQKFHYTDGLIEISRAGGMSVTADLNLEVLPEDASDDAFDKLFDKNRIANWPTNSTEED